MANWYILGRLLQEADKAHQERLLEQKRQEEQMKQALMQIQMYQVKQQLDQQQWQQRQEQMFKQQAALIGYRNSFLFAQRQQEQLNQQLNNLMKSPTFLSLPKDAQTQALVNLKKGNYERVIPLISEGYKNLTKQEQERKALAERKTEAYKFFNQNVLAQLPENERQDYIQSLQSGDLDTLLTYNAKVLGSQPTQTNDKFFNRYKKNISYIYANEHLLNDEDKTQLDYALKTGNPNLLLQLEGKIKQYENHNQIVAQQVALQKEKDKQILDETFNTLLNIEELPKDNVLYITQQVSKEKPYLYQLAHLGANISKEYKISPDTVKDYIHVIYYNDVKKLKEFGLSSKEVRALEIASNKLGLPKEQLLLYNGLTNTTDNEKQVFTDIVTGLAKGGKLKIYSIPKLIDTIKKYIEGKRFKTQEEAREYLSAIKVTQAVTPDGQVIPVGDINFAPYIEQETYQGTALLSGINKKLTKGSSSGTTKREEGDIEKSTESKRFTSQQEYDIKGGQVLFKINPDVFNYKGLSFGLREIAKKLVPQMSTFSLDWDKAGIEGYVKTGEDLFSSEKPVKKEEALKNSFGWE